MPRRSCRNVFCCLLAALLVCVACYGPVDITGLNIPAATGVVGRCVISRKGLMVRDVSQDGDFGAAVDEKTGFTTQIGRAHV